MSQHTSAAWHGTTILSVRKGRQVVVAGDGQVSLQNTILKPSARKVRKLAGGKILAGSPAARRTPSRCSSGSRPSSSATPAS